MGRSVLPRRKEENRDRSHRAPGSILAVVYVPYALFCFLLFMASETALTQTDPLRIAGGYLVAYAGLFTALTAHLCLFLSARLYRNGKQSAGCVVKFLPVITMVSAFLIALVLELLAHT